MPSENLSRNGICAASCSAQPGRIGNSYLDKTQRTIDRFDDVGDFRWNAAGGLDRRVGNSGRAVLIGPGTNNFDLQIFMDTKFRERRMVEFRWEMFNAFNHTQWLPPAAPAAFGKINATAAPRIMQLVLQYNFRFQRRRQIHTATRYSIASPEKLPFGRKSREACTATSCVWRSSRA